MGRHRKGKRKGRKGPPAVSGPFAGTYWHLRQAAARCGLFVLFDGDPAAPRLTFFETTRGVPLLDYWPKLRHWSSVAGTTRAGRCDQHEDVLAVARRMLGLHEREGSGNGRLSSAATRQFGS